MHYEVIALKCNLFSMKSMHYEVLALTNQFGFDEVSYLTLTLVECICGNKIKAI